MAAFYGNCDWYDDQANNDDDDDDQGDDSSNVECGCTEVYCGDNYDCFNTCGCTIKGDGDGEQYG